MSSTEYKKLKAEAEQLYRHYGKLKEQYREDRNNAALNESMRAVQSRYAELEAALNQLDENAFEPEMDLDRLEPTPFRIHKPVPVEKQYSQLDGLLSRLKPRTMISLLMLLVFGSILYFISDQRLGFYRVPTSSMTPTLIPDDQLISYKQQNYERGDIIVLRDPKEEGAFLVKRLIGTQGDIIRVTEGYLHVNSKKIEEPYIQEVMKYEFGPYRVPPGEILVLGDNRNASDDSHRWKSGVRVPIDSIVGKVRHIYRPLERFSRVHSYQDAFASVQ
jgi:signal peptidase I